MEQPGTGTSTSSAKAGDAARSAAARIPHGLMFHHFHGDNHPPAQGSLSADELRALLNQVGRERLLPAAAWLERAVHGRLRPEDVCLTFDDCLRCQYDVAEPVLRELGLTAFWFVPTSVLQGHLLRLEIYRAFRDRRFASVQEFYASFEKAVDASRLSTRARRALESFDPSSYLSDYPFYTEGDRRFRYLRDEVLGPTAYQSIMDAMIRQAGLRLRDLAENLWMDDECLLRLHAAGHIIGLHSHTHPTRIGDMRPGGQIREYRANHTYLANLLGKPPVTAAHPCGSYSRTTLRILREMGIQVAFRSNMSMLEHSELEIPREDAANLRRRGPAD